MQYKTLTSIGEYVTTPKLEPLQKVSHLEGITFDDLICGWTEYYEEYIEEHPEEFEESCW
jgi:hypothetical protein